MISIKLTAKHFGKNGTVHLGPDAVSNGHWMIRRTSLLNAAMFETEALAATAMDLGTSTVKSTFANMCFAPVVAWTTTSWLHDHHGGAIRVLTNAARQTAGVKDVYLAMIGANTAGHTLYAAGAKSLFRDAEAVDDAGFLVMPFDLNGTLMPCAICAAKLAEVSS